MPKKLDEREIKTSISTDNDKGDIKEQLTNLLFNNFVKKGFANITLIAIAAIISVILTIIINTWLQK